MKFSIQKETNHTYVKVHNERLDSLISPALKSELVKISQGGESQIILDLSECGYCDSSGLSSILVGNRVCEEAEGTFILCGLTIPVEKLLKLAMLDSILIITRDKESAEQLLIKKSEL